MPSDTPLSDFFRRLERRRFWKQEDKMVKRTLKPYLREMDEAMHPEKYSRRRFLQALGLTAAAVGGGMTIIDNWEDIIGLGEVARRLYRTHAVSQEGLLVAEAMFGKAAYGIARGERKETFSGYDLTGFNRTDDVPRLGPKGIKTLNAIYSINKDFYSTRIEVPFWGVVALYALAESRGFDEKDLLWLDRDYPDDPSLGSLEDVLSGKTKENGTYSHNPLIAMLEEGVSNIDHAIARLVTQALSDSSRRQVWDALSKGRVPLQDADAILGFIISNRARFLEVDDRIRGFAHLMQRRSEFEIERNIRLGLLNMRRAVDYGAGSAERMLAYHLYGIAGLKKRRSELQACAGALIDAARRHEETFDESRMRRFRLTLTNPIRGEGPIPGLTDNGDYDDYRPNRYGQHLALDIQAPIGTAVYPAAEGMVTFAGTNGESVRGEKLGIFIYVLHDTRLFSVYGHLHPGKLTMETVRRRQQEGPFYVSERRPFAEVGDTGNAQGKEPHLHFALFKEPKAYLNPQSFLPPMTKISSA
ncbi:M23 family metallopeptidase [Candidatus Woesearchaeota archaeon]|nr:M23 family metallopeptidase [Candidatus Woesearchaeota archaeon]